MKKLLIILIVGIFFISFASSFFPQPKNTIGYWAFDENLNGYNGSQDATGNGLDLSYYCTGGATCLRAPWYNDSTQAVLGESLNVSEGTATKFYNQSSLLDVGTNMSLSFWFYLRDWDDRYSTPFNAWNNSASSRLQVKLDESIQVITTSASLKNQTTVSLNTWYHVGVTYGGNNLTLYINGLPVDSGAETTLLNFSKGDTLANIGSSGDDNNWMHGYLDEMGLWNTTLTASEMSDLYDGGDCSPFPFYDIGVTLRNPKPSIISTSSIIFNSTVEPLRLNLTNSTFYIWYSNGTLFDKKTNLTFGENNVSSVNISGFDTPNSFIWNNKVCGINTTDYLCRWAISNWTFTTGGILTNPLYNSSTVETASEFFGANLTALQGNTPTNGKLIWNGTSYTATITSLGGDEYYISRTIDIPLNNQSVSWNFNWTLGGVQQSSATNTQSSAELWFTLCNATYKTRFLNLSFKDESNLSAINASIPSSSFVYYLGSGSVNKTYEYSNSVNHFNYTFCAVPNRTIYIEPYVQYKQGTDYPQRIWNPSVQSITNTITNKILYLLNSINGIYQTFIVLSPSGSVIEGVDILGYRTIDGEDVYLAQGSTDGSGGATFWLNPDFIHYFTFTKSGYDVYSLTYAPIGGSKNIILSSGAQENPVDDYTRGITYYTKPSTGFLNKNSTYNFNFTITSTYWTLDEFGMNLTYFNGTLIDSLSSSDDSGGTLNILANTTNQSRIIMKYYYIVNGTRMDGERYWLTQAPSDFSIYNFFTTVGTYISENIFGIESDDEGQFGKALISVLIILTSCGLLISRYGIQSEATLLGMLTGILLFLNTIDLLPDPEIFTNPLVSFGDLLVYIVLIITIGLIIKEERR